MPSFEVTVKGSACLTGMCDNCEQDTKLEDDDVEITTEVEFEVYCDTCGTGLCAQSKGINTYNRRMPAVRVEACQKCLKEAAGEAERRGYEEGKKEAIRGY